MAGVRQFDEDAALDKALGLFWEKGYLETSMQELAAVTGVQRGSLYNAYQGKEGIFLRAFDRYGVRFLAEMASALDKPDLHESVGSFFVCVIDSMTTGAPTRGCLSSKTALGGDDMDPAIRQVVQRLLNSIEATLLARLARAKKSDGLIVAPEDAARMILTFTRGLVIIERVYQEKPRLLETAAMFTSLLFKGKGR
jgi:AcrR family transcriptional regulator